MRLGVEGIVEVLEKLAEGNVWSEYTVWKPFKTKNKQLMQSTNKF